MQARLVDAQLSYHSGDRTRGRRSLASALRLGEREQLRLPFALERTWLGPVLRRDPELARAHRQLLGAGLTSPGLAPASQATTAPVTPIIVDQLSVEEGEVTPSASFVDDLGADSLDRVELIMAFEEAFDIEIPDEDAEKIRTVKDAIEYIGKNSKGGK